MQLLALLGKGHSVKISLEISRYIGKDKTRFKELMLLFLEGNHKITQRASLALKYHLKTEPQMILPFQKKIILNLQNDIAAAVKRNTLKILLDLPIQSKEMGTLADCCFKFLTTNEPVAVKAFSMDLLLKIAEFYPEIGTELKLILQANIPFEKPGYISRASKVLKALAGRNF